jgi:hypothetical protein
MSESFKLRAAGQVVRMGNMQIEDLFANEGRTVGVAGAVVPMTGGLRPVVSH